MKFSLQSIADPSDIFVVYPILGMNFFLTNYTILFNTCAAFHVSIPLFRRLPSMVTADSRGNATSYFLCLILSNSVEYVCTDSRQFELTIV